MIDVLFSTSIYEGGYQISKMGSNDGSIATDIKGGAPPYKYLWSTGSQKSNLDKLTAGIYSVVVTDQNGCSVTKSVTLIEPTPITLTLTPTTYGAYNTSCSGSKDGNVNLSISGGMPPYRFNWSNGSFDEDLTNVPSGKYEVHVTDVNKATEIGYIILTEPNKFEVSLTASSYPVGYNISCNGCSNGSITTTTAGGTLPATYIWEGKGISGQTSANVTNLGPGDYFVRVNDANGCRSESKTYLTEPPLNGWDKSGNVLDNTNWLGSTNNAPLILKTVNTERLRIAENGNVGIGNNNPQSKLDVNGNSNISGDLKIGGNFTFAGNKVIDYLPSSGGFPELFGIGRPANPGIRSACTSPSVASVYQFNGTIESNGTNNTGNYIMQMGFDGANGIIDIAGGSNIPRLLLNYYCGKDVDICTGANGGNVTMTSSTIGMVGIGAGAPYKKLTVNGDVSFANYNSSGSGNPGDGYSALEILGNNQTPTRRGISLDADPNGSFNFFINSNANQGSSSAFNFKNGDDGRTLMKLEVNGDIRISSLAGAGNNLIQSNNDGILSTIPLGTAGLGLWQTTNGTDIYNTNAGNVGIGTIIPEDKLQVGTGAAKIIFGSAIGAGTNYGTGYIGINASRQNSSTWSTGSDGPHNGGIIIYGNVSGDLLFSNIPNTGGAGQTNIPDAQIYDNTSLLIGANGDIAIGTKYTSGYKLSVNGNVRAKDIIVTLTGWSDFVFEENHIRMNILDKEAFYKKEKHLPNITSGKEIEKDGLQVGKTMNGMMQNIEENTLDITDLYKRMLLLEKENSELKENIKILNKKQ